MAMCWTRTGRDPATEAIKATLGGRDHVPQPVTAYTARESTVGNGWPELQRIRREQE